jgi:menaquinone-specific isochorismate synthase
MNLKTREQRLVSYGQRCPGLTADSFLRAARGQARFYWRHDETTWAGFGTAAELTAWNTDLFGHIEREAKRLFHGAVISQPEAAPRLFGGFAFSPSFLPDNTWSVFAPAYFVLPHYQFFQRGDEVWLTINVLLGPDEDPEDALPQMQEALEARYEWLIQPQSDPTPPIPLHADYPLSFEAWAEMLNEAIGRIRAGELQKVVLARVCELQFAAPVEVESALTYLEGHYPECYRFLFEPRAHHAFYGATPELLADVQGDNLQTMGLAGSIRRGKSPEEDEALASQILNDPKELLEHSLVVAAIREKLTPLTESIQAPENPGIFRLSNIQHLFTPVQAQLKERLGILRLVEKLHPTPAMGGTPRETALDFIGNAEPVPRGWYAAPVGWLDAEMNGEFAVAIRSAICQDRRVWLYAGAGIVGESIPQKEWDETALKFKPMLNAHGMGEGVAVP